MMFFIRFLLLLYLINLDMFFIQVSYSKKKFFFEKHDKSIIFLLRNFPP